MLVAHCDGSIIGGNPGGRGFAGWLIETHLGAPIGEGSNDLGEHPRMSNNVAEYAAILAALDYLVLNNLTTEKVQIRSDSQLTVKQLQGVWNCSAPVLKHLRGFVWAQAKKFSSVGYLWVPREYNTRADALSKRLWKCESPELTPR